MNLTINLDQIHKPVLKKEIIEPFLSLKDGIIIDCTTGIGGHSKALLEANLNIEMICIDKDKDALNLAKERLKEFDGRCKFICSSFATFFKKLANGHIDISIDRIKGVIADLGISSYQLDNKEFGFSFESDNLDMRMDKEAILSAFEVVNYYPLDKLEQIFKEYGEIKEYKKCAKIICDTRKIKPISSAKELSDLFLRHFKRGPIHPATLVFQAIRIEVNRELEELEELLKTIEELLLKETIIAIISFHSLEDRIVKHYFRKWERDCICEIDKLKCICGKNHKKGTQLTKKPITPTKEEIDENPRSRSAKLRIFKFN